MGRGLFSRCWSYQGGGNSGELFGIRTTKISVRRFGAASELKGYTSHEQALCLDLRDVAPMDGADTLPPTPVTLDGEEQDTPVSNHNRARGQ